jgi:hypothetical protein
MTAPENDPAQAELQALIDRDPRLMFLGEVASLARAYSDGQSQVVELRSEEQAKIREITDQLEPKIRAINEDLTGQDEALHDLHSEFQTKLHKWRHDGSTSDRDYLHLSAAWAVPTSLDWPEALRQRSRFDRLQPGTTIVLFGHTDQSGDSSDQVSRLVIYGSGNLAQVPKVIDSPLGKPRLLYGFEDGHQVMADWRSGSQVAIDDDPETRAVVDALIGECPEIPGIYSANFKDHAHNLAYGRALEEKYPELKAHTDRFREAARDQLERQPLVKVGQASIDRLLDALASLARLDRSLYDRIYDGLAQTIDEDNSRLWERLATVMARVDNVNYDLMDSRGKHIARARAALNLHTARPDRTLAAPFAQ